mgnify:CR=1 FL=1
MLYDNVLQTIGNTPIVRINNIGPDIQNIYAKLEAFNPLASVKDRLAIGIIEDAEKRGAIKLGQTVVEATSGNTGIALAMVCAVKGYPFVATMAESFSVERRKIMKALGAKVILTPAAERGSGMVKRAEELATQHGWFLARQFENEANPAYHRNTTGPEVLRDFTGMDLDYFVSQFELSGLRGPFNRYRAQNIDWHEIPELEGKILEQPAFFVTGTLDPVNFFVPSDQSLTDRIKPNYKNLLFAEELEGIGHWTQQEAPEEVNSFILDFLKRVS